jgi:hypothetical protein
MVEFALNSSVSATTGFAPFELNHGYMPIIGQSITTDTKYTGVKQFTSQALRNLMAVHNAIIESHVMQCKDWYFIREQSQCDCSCLGNRDTYCILLYYHYSAHICLVYLLDCNRKRFSALVGFKGVKTLHTSFPSSRRAIVTSYAWTSKIHRFMGTLSG